MTKSPQVQPCLRAVPLFRAVISSLKERACLQYSLKLFYLLLTLWPKSSRKGVRTFLKGARMALRFGSIFVTPSLWPRPFPVQMKHFWFVTVAFRLLQKPVNIIASASLIIYIWSKQFFPPYSKGNKSVRYTVFFPLNRRELQLWDTLSLEQTLPLIHIKG